MSKKTPKTSKPTKPAVKKADAKAVVNAPAEARVQKNGITRPADGTLCAKVWDALDKLKAGGKDLTFDAVRELAGKEMADATIRTQRQRWNKFNA